MCTVIVRVAPGTPWPVTILALRDESPERPWDPLGAWWPTIDDSVRGIHDRSAGGAWLAGSDRTRSVAVVLNRDPREPSVAEPTTRGKLPLDAVTSGADPTGPQTARPFNLVRADPDGVRVTSWDGVDVRTTELAPGIHMIAETEADDLGVPRIARWLDVFRSADAPVAPPRVDPLARTSVPLARASVASRSSVDDGWGPWLDALVASTELDASDPAAIVRDHTGLEGRFATLSIVTAAVGSGGVVMRHSRLGEPAAIGSGAAAIDSGPAAIASGAAVIDSGAAAIDSGAAVRHA